MLRSCRSCVYKLTFDCVGPQTLDSPGSQAVGLYGTWVLYPEVFETHRLTLGIKGPATWDGLFFRGALVSSPLLG